MDAYLKRIRQQVGHDEVKSLGSLVLVFNDQGQVLLQLRSDYKVWGLPGGSMDANETPAQCALREVKEETGLELLELELFAFTSAHASNHAEYPNLDKIHAHTFLFSCTDWAGELSTEDAETLELQFFNLNALPELLPNMSNAIELFKQWLPTREFIFD